MCVRLTGDTGETWSSQDDPGAQEKSWWRPYSDQQDTYPRCHLWSPGCGEFYASITVRTSLIALRRRLETAVTNR